MTSGFSSWRSDVTTTASTTPAFGFTPPIFTPFGSAQTESSSSTSTSMSTTTSSGLFSLPQTTSAGSADKEPKKGGTSRGEGSPFPKPLSPWRRVEWTEEERSSLLERLSSYTPSLRDVPQARILLLGPVGSGKSSFISSVQSVFDGRVSTRAMVGYGHSSSFSPRATLGNVGNGLSSSFTRKLQSFPLRARDNVRDSARDGARDGARDNVRDGARARSTALVLCDMMGFGDGVASGPTLQHMLGVIRGHAPEGFQFRPDQALSSDTEGYIKRPSLKEQIHCVVFVLDASRLSCGSYSKGISETFQLLRRYISDMGVHQVVLLTHVDQICPETARDTSEVYDSLIVRDTINKAAELVGISVSSVVPVRNYWCELDLDLCSDVLLLRAMDHILQYTELLFTEEKPARAKEEY